MAEHRSFSGSGRPRGPRDPLRSTGPAPHVNSHKKSAPETNSKAISRGSLLHDFLTDRTSSIFGVSSKSSPNSNPKSEIESEIRSRIRIRNRVRIRSRVRISVSNSSQARFEVEPEPPQALFEVEPKPPQALFEVEPKPPQTLFEVELSHPPRPPQTLFEVEPSPPLPGNRTPRGPLRAPKTAPKNAPPKCPKNAPKNAQHMSNISLCLSYMSNLSLCLSYMPSPQTGRWEGLQLRDAGQHSPTAPTAPTASSPCLSLLR